jgi:AcrR family transcriptional regulator
MGRRAGVTPEETRAGLLSAAARVFARKGYDGASIADITAEAGLSRGAIYNIYGSKALLFAAVLDQHGTREMQDLLGRDDVHDIADLVSVIGSTLDRSEPSDVSLLVEAIVTCKRDPELAALVQRWFTDREDDFAGLIATGQTDGVVNANLSPETLSRFATMLALGSLLVGALGLPATDHDDWTRLIAWLVYSFRARPSSSQAAFTNDS